MLNVWLKVDWMRKKLFVWDDLSHFNNDKNMRCEWKRCLFKSLVQRAKCIKGVSRLWSFLHFLFVTISWQLYDQKFFSDKFLMKLVMMRWINPNFLMLINFTIFPIPDLILLVNDSKIKSRDKMPPINKIWSNYNKIYKGIHTHNLCQKARIKFYNRFNKIKSNHRQCRLF